MSLIYYVLLAMMCGATASNLYGCVRNYKRLQRLDKLYEDFSVLKDEYQKAYDAAVNIQKEYEEMMAYTE